MAKATQKTIGWNAVRKHINAWDKSSLLALLKDLYQTSSENRDFINARCMAPDSGEDVLKPYRKKIKEQFYPERGYAPLKLGEARKAIRDYRKATGNVQGTAELLLTYVETGTCFTHAYGDMEASFYISLESVLKDLAVLLRREGPHLYSLFRDRLAKLEEMAGNIGWGYGDYVAEIVDKLRDEFEDREA